jgi:hypothetical protein
MTGAVHDVQAIRPFALISTPLYAIDPPGYILHDEAITNCTLDAWLLRWLLCALSLFAPRSHTQLQALP